MVFDYIITGLGVSLSIFSQIWLGIFQLLPQKSLEVWEIIRQYLRSAVSYNVELSPETILYQWCNMYWNRTGFQLGQSLPSKNIYIFFGMRDRITLVSCQRIATHLPFLFKI